MSTYRVYVNPETRTAMIKVAAARLRPTARAIGDRGGGEIVHLARMPRGLVLMVFDGGIDYETKVTT